jgi:hypothetical protein
MGGKSDSPDYSQLALSQGEQNDQTITNQTYANRPTQYTPWGYTNWTNERVTDPGSGNPTTRWSQTSGLTPELQSILNKEIALQGGRSDLAGSLMGRVNDEFGTPMDFRGLSPMGRVPTSQFTLPEGSVGDPNQFRQQTQDAMYNQASSRLDPMYAGKRQELETKMRNQGIGPEDAAWKAQMGSLGNQETDAYNQAQWSSVGAGRDESNSMYSQLMGNNQNQYNQAMGANNQNFNQSMQGSQYANQIRQQQIAEQMQTRGASLNEINALLSGQQVQAPQMPNFQPAGSAQPAPVYQAGVDQGNFDQASNPMSGLMGLGGTLGGAYLGRQTTP